MYAFAAGSSVTPGSALPDSSTWLGRYVPLSGTHAEKIFCSTTFVPPLLTVVLTRNGNTHAGSAPLAISPPSAEHASALTLRANTCAASAHAAARRDAIARAPRGAARADPVAQRPRRAQARPPARRELGASSTLT